MAETIPDELDGARVLKYSIVTASVRPTGATYHERAGVRIETASALAVAKYDSDSDGYYLFYLSSDGQVMIDTWHESVERALHQAEFEYEGLSWVDVSD